MSTLKNILLLLLISSVIFLHSCKPKPEVSAYDEHFQHIMLKDEGHFRGVNIGDDIETVKQKEEAEIIEEENNYLYYDAGLEGDDYFNIAYFFDKTGVYEINFVGSFTQKEKADNIFTSFHDYFTRLHGNPTIEEGYNIWKTESEVSSHIEIALISHSTNEEGGFVSLSVLNYDY